MHIKYEMNIRETKNLSLFTTKSNIFKDKVIKNQLLGQLTTKLIVTRTKDKKFILP